MNQATKEAVATIARLPEAEMRQALSVASAARKIHKGLLIKKSFPIDEHGSYQRNKPAVTEVLELMGVKFTGGHGPGDKKIATLEKI